MKPSRFTEEQIIGILREQEKGAKTADVCRKHGVSSATFYKWKAKYGGLEVSDAKRLKALEDENAKLKRLLAEAMLGVDPVRPDTRLVEVLQCTPAVSGSPAGNAGVLSCNPPSSDRCARARFGRREAN